MGLRCSIFKNVFIGPCDGLGNFSSRFNEVCLVSSKDFEIDGPSEPTEDCPPVVVVKRYPCGPEPYLTAYPAIKADDDGAWIPDRQNARMAGGSYISSCDFRFHEHFTYPVPLHDRVAW